MKAQFDAQIAAEEKQTNDRLMQLTQDAKHAKAHAFDLAAASQDQKALDQSSDVTFDQLSSYYKAKFPTEKWPMNLSDEFLHTLFTPTLNTKIVERAWSDVNHDPNSSLNGCTGVYASVLVKHEIQKPEVRAELDAHPCVHRFRRKEDGRLELLGAVLTDGSTVPVA